MSFWDLLGTAVRRWYVTLGGMIVTALALAMVFSTPGLYFAHVRVVVLAPEPTLPNAYQWTLASLVEFTGAVGRAVQGSGGTATTVSESTTLVGEGYRSGYSIRQPNVGGQWQYTFREPVLDVQAVGETKEEAEQEIRTAVTLIEDTVRALQEEQGVAPELMIRTQLAPTEPQVGEVKGERSRALAMTGLIGMLVTAFVLVRWGPPPPRTRRPARRRGPEDGEVPEEGEVPEGQPQAVTSGAYSSSRSASSPSVE